MIDDISWCVPHFTPSISSQKIMLGHFVSETATALSFIKRSSYRNDVTTENNWTFELGVVVGIDIPICVIHAKRSVQSATSKQCFFL